jgi:hypothetical protein
MCNYPTKLNSKIAWLEATVDSADRAPTQQAIAFYKELRSRADAQLAAWREIVARDVAALNELAARERLPAVSVK